MLVINVTNRKTKNLKEPTVTFTSSDRYCTFTVKRTYLGVLMKKTFFGFGPSFRVDPSFLSLEEHVENGISNHLHNESGPAVTYENGLSKIALDILNDLPDSEGLKSYWLNGQQLTGKKRKAFIKKLNKGEK